MVAFFLYFLRLSYIGVGSQAIFSLTKTQEQRNGESALAPFENTNKGDRAICLLAVFFDYCKT